MLETTDCSRNHNVHGPTSNKTIVYVPTPVYKRGGPESTGIGLNNPFNLFHGVASTPELGTM